MSSQGVSVGLFSSHQHQVQRQHRHDRSDFEHKETQDESDNESDFFADVKEDDDWVKTNSNLSSDQGDANTNMIMDLSAVFPVGGMHRVSSCYFSICSNISSDDNPNNSDSINRVCESPFASSFDDNNTTAGTTADFLYHDILMNVFTYLDAHSLASFSETGKRPNFECFYFLELQLQRGLLRGSTTIYKDREGSASFSGDNKMNCCLEEDGLLFIAGTGAISRVSQIYIDIGLKI